MDSSFGDLEICANCDGVDRCCCTSYQSWKTLSAEEIDYLMKMRMTSEELGEMALVQNQQRLEDYEISVQRADTNADTLIMHADERKRIKKFPSMSDYSIADEIDEGADIEKIAGTFPRSWNFFHK